VPFDMSDVVLDSEFCEPVVIYRQSGTFLRGQFVLGAVVQIPCLATVIADNVKDLDQAAVADRVKGIIEFYFTREIFLTGDVGAAQQTSDTVLWKGKFYKLFQSYEWGEYGFWHCGAYRIEGV